jgi:hypothetical protein
VITCKLITVTHGQADAPSMPEMEEDKQGMDSHSVQDSPGPMAGEYPCRLTARTSGADTSALN